GDQLAQGDGDSAVGELQRIILSSGTTYDVLHPEMLFISKSGMTVAIYDRDQRPSPDEIPVRESLVSFLHIAETEDLPQPTLRAG
ncbi:MAG TPA: hypothetical protein PLD59_07370, partial [Tepidisphaeraceae bacterium]|nr:hypothetical protein [Tepidisphaeraceae bacterium]